MEQLKNLATKLTNTLCNPVLSIEAGWLLVYRKDKTKLILILVRTGAHDEILR